MMRKLALVTFVLALSLLAVTPAFAGATTANGWYEGEEIYYILHGMEEGVTQRGGNDLYLIGNDRLYQANVAEFIPGEAGYTPHWNVNVVNTAAVKLWQIFSLLHTPPHITRKRSSMMSRISCMLKKPA